MALRLAAEEGLSRSGGGVWRGGYGIYADTQTAYRGGNGTAILYCLCRMHDSCDSFFPSLPRLSSSSPRSLPRSLPFSCSFSRRCCCRSLFDSQLEVEVTSNLCAVICPLSFPYPTPSSPIVGYICKLPAINFCPFAIKHLKRFVQSKRKKLRKKATNRSAKTKRANHFHSIFPHDALLVLYNQRFSHHFHTQLTERERGGKSEGRIESESWENA